LFLWIDAIADAMSAQVIHQKLMNQCHACRGFFLHFLFASAVLFFLLFRAGFFSYGFYSDRPER
tara:strand:- start:1524 stop:1715 length:192 start_codon:yes stop_codon:yes gene_type:complete